MRAVNMMSRRRFSSAAAAAPRLFTPGPLTTSTSVKAAMMTDMGSRDEKFIKVLSGVQSSLLAIAGAGPGTPGEGRYEAVLMQGSGTFGVESALGSLIPRAGAKLLVASNGAYGRRMVDMARVLGIECAEVSQKEWLAVDVDRVAKAAAADPAVTHVAAVHHETTAGVLNDMPGLSAALARVSAGRKAGSAPISLIVDSMSAFGAYPVDIRSWGATAVVSSANKCIEGVPGFSFAVVERAALEASKGNARSLSLDMHAQWAGLKANGQFRFTPPTHSLLAFGQALSEHAAEGGAPGRLARYQRNAAVLMAEMAKLGFEPYIASPAERGCIITTFLVPDSPRFRFQAAYDGLAKRGCLIYPGKTTAADSFRIGSIGQLFEDDMRGVVRALAEVLREQGVELPVRQFKQQE